MVVIFTMYRGKYYFEFLTVRQWEAGWCNPDKWDIVGYYETMGM